MQRVKAAEAAKLEQFRLKHDEIRDNHEKQLNINMNLERLKLILGFAKEKKVESEFKKGYKSALLKYHQELQLKSCDEASFKQNLGKTFVECFNASITCIHV